MADMAHDPQRGRGDSPEGDGAEADAGPGVSRRSLPLIDPQSQVPYSATIHIRKGSDGGQAAATGLDLPDLLQHLGSLRRSGELTVRSGRNSCTFHLVNGLLCAVTGGQMGALSRSLRWTGDRGDVLDARLPADDDEAALALLAAGADESDQTLTEAIHLHLLGAVVVSLGWEAIVTDFAAATADGAWRQLQERCVGGVALGPLLMEALRWHDELHRVAEFIPATWDVLVPVAKPGDEDIAPGARPLLVALGEGAPFAIAAARAAMPPWETRWAAGLLIEQGQLAVAPRHHALAWVDSLEASGDLAAAERTLRQCMRVAGEGAHAAGAALLVRAARLAERRGDHPLAVQDLISAAEVLAPEDASLAIPHIQRAISLAGEPPDLLDKLWRLQLYSGQTEAAVETLFDLAEIRVEGGQADHAIELLRRAEELGADPARSSLALAYALRGRGAVTEAIVHLERAVQVGDVGDGQIAQLARSEILALDPARVDIGLELLRRERQAGHHSEALALLTSMLGRSELPTEAEVALREELARLAPDDGDNRSRLADLYQQRQDRASALSQLAAVATGQRESGEVVAEVETLGRMLALGGLQPEVRRRHAALLGELGRDRASRRAWLAAVEGARLAGELEVAAQLAESALLALPQDPELHQHRASIAARQGDRSAAQLHSRAAAWALRAGGQHRQAYDLLLRSLDGGEDQIATSADLISAGLDLGLMDRAEALALLAGGDGLPQQDHSQGRQVPLTRRRVRTESVPSKTVPRERPAVAPPDYDMSEQLAEARRTASLERHRAGRRAQAVDISCLERQLEEARSRLARERTRARRLAVLLGDQDPAQPLAEAVPVMPAPVDDPLDEEVLADCLDRIATLLDSMVRSQHETSRVIRRISDAMGGMR